MFSNYSSISGRCAATCDKDLAPPFLMTPFSVRARRAGMVLDHAIARNPFVLPWVLAGTTQNDLAKKATFNRRVNRTVDVLQRFVQVWTFKSRLARSRSVRAACSEIRRWADLGDAWSNVAYDGDMRLHKRFLKMEDADWRAYCQSQIAEYRAAGRDIIPVGGWSLLRWMKAMSQQRETYKMAQEVLNSRPVEVWVGTVFLGVF